MYFTHEGFKAGRRIDLEKPDMEKTMEGLSACIFGLCSPCEFDGKAVSSSSIFVEYESVPLREASQRGSHAEAM